MKTQHAFNRLFVGSCVALSALLSVSTSYSGYVEITVNDGTPGSYYGTDPRPGISESGQVTANCVANSSWDLRAMAFDVNTNSLMVVSGFNPLAKNFDQNVTGDILGDIFVDTNNSFTSPSRAAMGIPATDGHFPYANSTPGNGFEYAIHLIDPSNSTGNNLRYNLVALSGASLLETGNYNQNASTDPAFLIPTGADTIKSGGLSVVTTMSDAQVFADLGLNIGTNGGTNYVFTFDLSAASLANGANFRLTEECGNDLLVGYLAPSVNSVPETSAWVMGFLALGAVVLMVWRSQASVCPQGLVRHRGRSPKASPRPLWNPAHFPGSRAA